MATSLPSRPNLQLSATSTAQAPAILLAAAGSEPMIELQSILRSWGHSLETAADGAALLEAIDRPKSAPIVIFDDDLPGLRCMTLLNQLQLQSNRRRSWTILLSENPQSFVYGTTPASQAAVDDVLTKPIDEFELRVSLRAASRIQARCAELAEAMDAAQFSATHDSLTGLLNRESLLKLLFQETDRTQRLGTPLAFLLLDLDQFAAVNREHGYDGGDRILRQLASRFRRFLRSYDVAGRCGGDQFLIAMPGCSTDDAQSMANRLRDAIAERPFDILQTTVQMTASIGIAHSLGRSPLTVLREAEHALSRAKLAGGSCIRWFPGAAGTSAESVGAARSAQPAELRPARTSVPA